MIHYLPFKITFFKVKRLTTESLDLQKTNFTKLQIILTKTAKEKGKLERENETVKEEARSLRAKNVGLEQKISKKESEISQIRLEFQSFKRLLEQNNENEKRKFHETEKEAMKMNFESENLSKKYEILWRQKQELEGMYGTSKSDSEHWARLYRELEISKEKMKGEWDRSLGKLRRENETMRADLESASQVVNLLQQNEIQLKSNIDKKEQNIDICSEKIDDFEKKRRKWKSKKQNIEGVCRENERRAREVESLRREKERGEERRRAEHEKRLQTEHERDMAKKQIERMRNEIVALEKQLLCIDVRKDRQISSEIQVKGKSLYSLLYVECDLLFE